MVVSLQFFNDGLNAFRDRLFYPGLVSLPILEQRDYQSHHLMINSPFVKAK
jgi:hypothetical protein